MKRRRLIFTLGALSLSTLVVIIALTFGAIYASNADPVERISAEIHRTYLNEIIYNYKNDLLSANYRFFRNQIASLMARDVFSDYAVIASGKVVDASDTFAAHAARPGQVKISVPVWFDEAKREPWGSVELLVSKTPRINDLILNGLQEFLLSVLGVFLLLTALYLWLWNWLYFSLSRGMEAIFAGLEPNGRLGGYFWGPLLGDLNRLKKGHDQLALEARENQQHALTVELNRQVAHDIRSPLAALRYAAGDMGEIDEDRRRLLRHAVERINDIANDLWQKGAETAPAPATVMLASLVEAVVSEKRLRHQEKPGVSLKVDLSHGYGLFAQIHPGKLQRALSNVIDNAIEALPFEGGQVEIRLTAEGQTARISITDNGSGIAESLLRRVTERGFSAGKGALGSGLGLAQAKKALEEAQGSLAIESPPATGGGGTRVVFSLAKAPCPAWFAPCINVGPNGAIVAIDDDEAILALWRDRFGANGTAIQAYGSPGELEEWLSRQAPGFSAMFLIDYDLGEGVETGLDLIERLQVSRASHLVTSRFDDPKVQAQCRRLGVSIVPKGLAGLVPLRHEE